MKIYIIGAGCVGSVIAEKIYNSKNKNELKLIADGDLGKKLKKSGIKVNGKKYLIPIAAEEETKPDLLFVCVKNYDLEQACKDLGKYIDNNTIILPLLNSISPTEILKEKFPNNRVLYGYITKIDSYKENDEYKYNLAGDIHFGYDKNNEIMPELKTILTTLEDANFNTFIDKDMIRGIWKKWMLNVGANQVSALTEANYLQFAKIPEIEEVLRLAMQELLTIACYEKVNLSTMDVIEIIEYLTTYPYPKQTSMLQDILNHRKTEIDYISGDILKLSKKWNYPCPVNLSMYYLIKAKESTYLKGDLNYEN